MGYIESLFSLEGKTALIVGGHGLYADALVKAFADAGVHTYIAARNTEAMRQLAQLCPGNTVEVVELDLSSEDSIEHLVSYLQERESRIDILINNAVARTMKSFHDDIKTFAQSMSINATGMFQLTRQIGNWMARHQGGSIINVGSIQGIVGPDPSLYVGLDMDGMIPDYFYHKAGMANLTRFMASYYGSYGIRCNCIIPGGVYTEKLSPEFVNRYNQRTMLGRMAVSEDIVGITLFLASDASQYITGANIPVDGGYTAK